MARLIGLSGSLRKGSYDAALLREVARRLYEGSHIEIHLSHDIPLHDGDIEEAEGIPAVVSGGFAHQASRQ